MYFQKTLVAGAQTRREKKSCTREKHVENVSTIEESLKRRHDSLLSRVFRPFARGSTSISVFPRQPKASSRKQAKRFYRFYQQFSLGHSQKNYLQSVFYQVDLSKHTGFLGGLERNLSTGTTAPYYCNSTTEVMFHASTRMPLATDSTGFNKKVKRPSI